MCAEACLQPSAGELQLCLSLHCHRASDPQKVSAFPGLSRACAWPSRCPRYAGVFQSLNFFFLALGLAYCLPQLLSTIAGSYEVGTVASESFL